MPNFKVNIDKLQKKVKRSVFINKYVKFVTYAISVIKKTKTNNFFRIIRIVTNCALLTLQLSIELYYLGNIVYANKHLLHHDGRKRERNRYLGDLKK